MNHRGIDIFEIRFVEEVSQIGLVCPRDSENLKDLVDAPLQSHIVLYNSHQAISDYGTIGLDADNSLRDSPESIDTQVLFDSFEGQLHAPSVA